MHPFSFLLPLVSVFVGLAVTDVAKSLHTLLRARQRVRWDALPLASAFIAVLTTYNLWWRLLGTADPTPFLTLGGFLPLAAQLLVLYLLCAAVLPDAVPDDGVPDDGVDLRTFYDGNGPYVWTLFALHIVLLIATRSFLFPTEPVGAGRVAANVVALVLVVGLAVVRTRRVHAVALALLCSLALLDWAGLSLAP